MSNAIEIKNVGPIESLSIPLPETGGVVVLRGGQGAGKSTALRAIEAAAGSKPDGLSLRDGARRGEVQFAGAKLSITKARTARRGELEVDTIEGKYDVGALVDPGIKDEERADAARIKQLIALTGAKADHAAYKSKIGSYLWDQLDIDPTIDDPLELYAEVVKSLQKLARQKERESDQVSVTIPDELVEATRYQGPTLEEAKSAAREAADNVVRLEAKQEASEASIAKYNEAVAMLDKIENEYDGPTVADAEKELSAARYAVDELERALSDARAKLDRCEASFKMASDHQSSVAHYRRILESSRAEPIEQETIDEARDLRARAELYVDKASDAAKARAELQRLRQANERSELLANEANVLRESAKHAEEVLASCLPEGDLRVDDGRIVVATDRSTSELYADLSHGERAIFAIRAAATHMPPGAVATISQEIWGGISDVNRQMIANEAAERGVTIITAEVTDEPLDVEVM